jgi:hypothetical protein
VGPSSVAARAEGIRVMPESPARTPACRVEVRALSPDLNSPSGGPLIAAAEPTGDGQWHLSHRDGRHVIVATTVEVIERLIGVACDASLAERWRRRAALLPPDSEQAATLRRCASELLPAGPVASVAYFDGDDDLPSDAPPALPAELGQPPVAGGVPVQSRRSDGHAAEIDKWPADADLAPA